MMLQFERLIFNLSIFAIFGLLHSITASGTIKDRLSIHKQSYRLIYNIFNSLIFLIVLVIIPLPAIGSLVIEINKIISVIFIITGSLIFIWGVLSWDIPGFLGITEESKNLVTDKAYRLSRHPVYSGIITILFGLVIGNPTTTNFSWLIGAGGYFVIGSIPEEQKLENIFGTSYQKYKQNAGRIFPFKPCHFRYLLSGDFNCTK